MEHSTASEYGDDVLWTANKQFLDNQIKQGKEFIFTVNPETLPDSSFTYKEFDHIINQNNGYSFIKEGDTYRAIKK